MIPEIPILGTTEFKVKCVVCSKPIAGWVIAESKTFCCPSCNQKLQSNYKTAKRKSIVTGVALYSVALVLFVFAPKESNIWWALYTLGGIFPLLVSYFVLK